LFSDLQHLSERSRDEESFSLVLHPFECFWRTSYLLILIVTENKQEAQKTKNEGEENEHKQKQYFGLVIYLRWVPSTCTFCN
jgi:hypothetical protein